MSAALFLLSILVATSDSFPPEVIETLFPLKFGESRGCFDPSKAALLENARVHQVSNAPLPDSVDWRKKGAVTPVKSQWCGDCYLFAAIASLEGVWARNHTLVSLSEQNVHDCDKKLGCHGGVSTDVFNFVKREGGIESEAEYRYTGARIGKCKYNSTKSVAADKGFVKTPAGNEAALQDAVANVGPVSVGLHLGWDFEHLKRGQIYNPPVCRQDIWHAVIIKNSWGTWWGDEGFYRVARGKNLCGIADHASYPLV